MAAPAPVQVELRPERMPWQRVVAEIDAMPGVPTWREIERQVDASVEATMDAEKRQSTTPRNDFYLMFEMHGRLVREWARQLARLFPAVHTHLARHTATREQLVQRGVKVWFAFRFLPVHMHLSILYSEWTLSQSSDNSIEPYVLTRITPAQADAALERQLRNEALADSYVIAGLERPWAASQQRLIDERFKAGLRAAIERKTTRTRMAQSGVIDLLAARQGSDVAQSIARLLAPDTVTLTRPLVIRQHELQLEQLRATMSASDRPEAVLARATRQLEHLVQDLDKQTQ